MLTDQQARIYQDCNDWWIGYYRGETHHYVCLLPTLVIRWARRPQSGRPVTGHVLAVSCEEEDAEDFTWLAQQLGRATKMWTDMGRILSACGFSTGKWTNRIVHVDSCDCDEDEETAGGNCLANSEWFYALLKDEGAHGWSLAFPLSDSQSGRADG